MASAFWLAWISTRQRRHREQHGDAEQQDADGEQAGQVQDQPTDDEEVSDLRT
jgi:hypothetical protein